VGYLLAPTGSAAIWPPSPVQRSMSVRVRVPARRPTSTRRAGPAATCGGDAVSQALPHFQQVLSWRAIGASQAWHRRGKCRSRIAQRSLCRSLAGGAQSCCGDAGGPVARLMIMKTPF
jgi:hypothetical protein